MSNAPPKFRTKNFQINTVAPPAISPAIAPYLFERFQNKERSTTGPNDAPSPAHAKLTIANTELLGNGY